MDGFSLAFNEITLVLFTTLAPSGALAYLIMGLPALTGRVRGAEARRLNQFSCVPLVVAMVGLIASATHLGNPSNALYVFAGVGRSPLSTEVFCAVAFLALAGVYWLYSFAEHPRAGLQRAMMAAIDVAIIAFIAGVAFAYDVDTILTWSLPLVPVSLTLNALLGGPILALVSFAAAGYNLGRRGICGLLALALAALAANIAVYVILGLQLQGIENELVSAAELVQGYPVYLATFALLALAAIALAWRAESTWFGEGARLSEGETAQSGEGAARFKRLIKQLAAASLLVLAALFLMRFTFYMTHLTIGLGV